MTPLCVNVKAAAELIGMSASVVRSYIDSGALPTVRFPSASAKHQGETSRRVLISVDDLRVFVEKHRVTAAADAEAR